MHFGQVQLVPLAATTCRAQQSLAFATTPAEIGQHPTLSPAFASDRPVFRLSTWSSDLSSHTLGIASGGSFDHKDKDVRRHQSKPQGFQSRAFGAADIIQDLKRRLDRVLGDLDRAKGRIGR